MSHDVLAFGEALLRLQPEGDERLEQAQRFLAHTGGAELNTCCALANLGLRSAWFSVLPEGPLGRRVLRHLRAAGVDASLVRSAPGRLGTYWVEYGREPRGIDVVYDRSGSTLCQVRHEDAPWEALRAARVFFVSGITPALSPAARELTFELAAAARQAGVSVATDLNYRARLWGAAEAAPVLERLAQSAQIVIATEEDLRVLYGWTGEPEEIARQALARFRCNAMVVTRGGEGGLCLESGRVRRAAVFPSSRVDRVGAGDAFTAGFLYATLTGREERALDYGLALAALKHSIPGDALLTSREEVERIVAREVKDIRR